MANHSSALTSASVIGKAIVALAGALFLSACAGGPLPASSQIPGGVVSNTLPAGYAQFCGRHQELCTLPAQATTAQAVVPMTAETEKQLSQVNVSINRAIRPMADAGKAGYWEPASAGDCKTYTVRKMQALLALGLPREALHVAIVRTPQAESHAVLTVDTDRGTYVLDNMSDELQPWEKLPYTFWSREAAPGQQWSFPALDGKGRIASIVDKSQS
ncbi:transglutaminase-like cysteine peptidase [Telmatospirillum siberiense]|uniref:transglutaminase-like cysteine peptidase n=1 Tax=Telmatospirillum siberiense TaxID=382514 RepID=UPI00130432CF|nr:transglutaminase-like cysteine peptidase [Telmatospirillum siberiense]